MREVRESMVQASVRAVAGFVYHWDSASPTMGFQRLSFIRPILIEKKGRE